MAVSESILVCVRKLQILEVMAKAIPAPRPELSQYAPRIVSFNIPVDKIRDDVPILPWHFARSERIEESGLHNFQSVMVMEEVRVQLAKHLSDLIRSGEVHRHEFFAQR